jgi:hypothetical protein
MPEVFNAAEQPMFSEHLLVNLRQLQNVGLLRSQEKADEAPAATPTRTVDDPAEEAMGRLEAEGGSRRALASPPAGGAAAFRKRRQAAEAEQRAELAGWRGNDVVVAAA